MLATSPFQVRVADLPGLIEGASINKGLGHAFLKHTEKAKALALVVSTQYLLNIKETQPGVFL